MTKPVIVTRLGKGSELTFAEGDANFTNLQNATLTIEGDQGSATVDLNSTVVLSGGVGVNTEVTGNTVTLTGFSGDFTDLSNKPTIPTNNTELTNGAGYITDYTVTESDVTVHQAALSITQAQISDLDNFITDYTVTESDVTAHQAALSITQDQISDLDNFITGIDGSAVVTALGFDPENTANKNVNNGYAGLDAGGKVAAAQLPSYVDDVEEYANQAAFPANGETGKIYVALDNNKIFRWSGSAYVEISASPGSTDAVTEGTTNLYFTTQRARDAFSASTGITITNGVVATTITQYTDSLARSSVSAGTGIGYDNSTGVISSTVTQYADSDARAAVSVTDAGGDGSLAYDSSTGVVTYTGPSASEVRAHISAGTGISISDGEITNTVTAGISAVQDDATPTLGGNLTVNGNQIRAEGDDNLMFITGGSGGLIMATQLGANVSLGSNGTKIDRLLYTEKIHDFGTTSGTIVPNVQFEGNVQTITLNGNLTLNEFATSAVAGQSLTLIINTNGTGRTLTSSMLFAGGEKTLSDTNTTDIISVFFDGTNYFASLSKGFA